MGQHDIGCRWASCDGPCTYPMKHLWHWPFTNQKTLWINNSCWKAMARDGFYNKETKQFLNDGRRLCASMEILPLQVAAMDIKCQVQQVLTLKQVVAFLAIFSPFFIFPLLCGCSLLLDFTILWNFIKKKDVATNLLRCVSVNFTNLLVFSIHQICWNVGSTNHWAWSIPNIKWMSNSQKPHKFPFLQHSMCVCLALACSWAPCFNEQNFKVLLCV